MPEQLLLLEVPAVAVPRGNWFFALRPAPDPLVTARLRCLAFETRADRDLRGRPLADDRFHVSLHKLRNLAVPRRAPLDEACAAVAANCAPFELVFDRVASFGGRLGKKAVALWGDRSAAPQNFRRQLAFALFRAGLGHFDIGHFTPHVTLLYDARTVAEYPVPPLAWRVNEFFLVQSLTGESRHVVHGHWTLRG